MKLLCVGKQLQFAWTYNAKFNVIIVKDEHVPKNGDGKASIWRWVVSSEKNNKTFINGCSITTNIFILSIISTLILYCIINLYCIYILLIASLPLTTNTPEPLETTPFITTPDVGVSPPQYAVIRPPQASVPPGSAVQLECNAIGMLVHISPFLFWGLSDHVCVKGLHDCMFPVSTNYPQVQARKSLASSNFDPIMLLLVMLACLRHWSWCCGCCSPQWINCLSLMVNI